MNKPPYNISQELELLSSLEARGEVPLKFAYMGDGWKYLKKIIEMSQKKAGGLENIEHELLRQTLQFIFKDLESLKPGSNINIVDLGCGDGTPILVVFKFLAENNFLERFKFRYVPIDISESLLNIAEREVKSHYNVPVKKIRLDFEKGNFLNYLIEDYSTGRHYNYCFFLGNTLGNFSDMNRVLSNFRDSLFSTDYLIIGNELANLQAVNDILNYYKSKSVFDLVISPLTYYGLKKRDVKYSVRWNRELHQVEAYVNFKRVVRLKIAGEEVVFDKGDEVLLFRSRKLTEAGIIKLLASIGFRIQLFSTSKDRRYMIVNVNPTRFRTG